MSTAEHTIGPADGAARSGGVASLLVRVTLVASLIAWTVYWIRQAIPMVQMHTRIGSGAWGPTLDGHDIFEFVFVASHCLVRWAPGAVLLGAALVLLRWKTVRARRLAPA